MAAKVIPHQLHRVAAAQYAFDGWLDDYLRNVSEHWVKTAPTANPGMLEMFRDRDRRPLRDMMVWAGEFAGKYLTGAVQLLRLTGDKQLKAMLKDFVAELIACQASDGYLGPWPKGHHLTGTAPNQPGRIIATWDAWGHYHIMLALLLWHEQTGDKKALACAKRIGDLFCRKFLHKRRGDRLVDTGCTEMNLAPIHSLCLLYRRTPARKYLQLAEQVADEFAAPGPKGPLAGDYIRSALAGKDFYQTPRPRWESLHPIMGLAELYWLTGREDCREAFEHIFWSIVRLDRHNNGGFSSGEAAKGNPYDRGAIETCCTIAWIAMGVEMLKMTGNSVVADELELSTINSVVGLHSPSGRWVTYDTPMDGVRRASTQSIAFQAREGTPELNCCSCNGHRGFGMISDWAVMRGRDGAVVLNYFGPSEMTIPLRRGLTVKLIQKTRYPIDGRVVLKVHPSRPVKFPLDIRIPHWSARTAVRVNGRAVRQIAPGEYLRLEKKWKTGDVVEIRLDFSPHFWTGKKQCKALVSMYRGPVLLAYDRRFNQCDPNELPTLDARSLKGRIVKWDGAAAPILLMLWRDGRGRSLRLCDFGSAGVGGSPYKSWLKIRNAPAGRFSRSNPLRSVRV